MAESWRGRRRRRVKGAAAARWRMEASRIGGFRPPPFLVGRRTLGNSQPRWLSHHHRSPPFHGGISITNGVAGNSGSEFQHLPCPHRCSSKVEVNLRSLLEEAPRLQNQAKLIRFAPCSTSVQ